jgi:hypothetical protein
MYNTVHLYKPVGVAARPRGGIFTPWHVVDRMVVDWDEAEPVEGDEEPQTWKQRLMQYASRMLPIKT